jgi:nucleotide-binding universal stress UspA family protein
MQCGYKEPVMPGYILLPATGRNTDGPVFATALAAARLLPAHLEFLHVHVDVQAAVIAMASGDVGGGVDYGEIMQALERDAVGRQEAAERAGRDFCKREGVPLSAEALSAVPSAEWRLETGDAAGWLAERGRAADLVVVGRARDGEAVALDLLEAALMETGRPMLIAPPRPPGRLAGVVAIAWKNRPEAARAVAVAEPFLTKADRVVILTVAEDERTHEASGERLRHALTWHNPRTTVQSVNRGNRPAVEVLLEAAAVARVDLLVMGGYGHSRVREVIFGGFTRHILLHADLPVLMAH